MLQKNGKYWKECNVVMLPSTNDSGYWFSFAHKRQHLYILSNEQVNEGDWIGYPNLKNWTPVQYLKGDLTGSEKKIIASTDNLAFECQVCKELSKEQLTGFTCINCNNTRIVNSLPKISNDFIKKYVESSRAIKKVLVEYEPPCDCRPMCKYPIEGKSCKQRNEGKFSLRLNLDNTINILLEDSVEEAAIKSNNKFIKQKEGNLSKISKNEIFNLAFLAGAEWQKNQLKS